MILMWMDKQIDESMPKAELIEIIATLFEERAELERSVQSALLITKQSMVEKKPASNATWYSGTHS